jgi:glycine/serine hydroxymethyltransferase
MKEAAMETIAEMIDEILRNIGNSAVYASMKQRVATFCSTFPLYAEI